MAKLRNSLEKDKKVIVLVVLAFAFIIYMVTLFGRAAYYVNRFNYFHGEVLSSISVAGKGTKTYLNGEEGLLDEHDWDRMFYLMDSIKNGKMQKEFPGDESGEFIKICFKDETILEICETDIPEEERLRDDGVCIRYTDENGKVMIFDTDKCGYEAFTVLFD